MSIIDKIETWRNRKEYQRNFEKSKQFAILSELLYKENKEGYTVPIHPLFEKRREAYDNHIKLSLPKDRKVHLNFGDSLTDLARDQLKDIDGIYSIAGSWSAHAYDMIRALTPTIYQEGIEVGKVSIGCLVGNPLLVYSNYEKVIEDALKTLNLCRITFDRATMIVYGIPPVYNLWATENSINIEVEFAKWCMNHGAIFISLREKFGQGILKLFPTMKYSCDGVHFNPEGAIRFNSILRDSR